MNESELVRVETELSMRLPAYYRATLLAYPFEKRTDIEGAELVNDPDLLISLNQDPAFGQPGDVFVIGTDGSEETYYIKPKDSGSAVYCFQLETGEHEQIAASWDGYLEQCAAQ